MWSVRWFLNAHGSWLTWQQYILLVKLSSCCGCWTCTFFSIKTVCWSANIWKEIYWEYQEIDERAYVTTCRVHHWIWSQDSPTSKIHYTKLQVHLPDWAFKRQALNCSSLSNSSIWPSLWHWYVLNICWMNKYVILDAHECSKSYRNDYHTKHSFGVKKIENLLKWHILKFSNLFIGLFCFCFSPSLLQMLNISLSCMQSADLIGL